MADNDKIVLGELSNQELLKFAGSQLARLGVTLEFLNGMTIHATGEDEDIYNRHRSAVMDAMNTFQAVAVRLHEATKDRPAPTEDNA